MSIVDNKALEKVMSAVCSRYNTSIDEIKKNLVLMREPLGVFSISIDTSTLEEGTTSCMLYTTMSDLNPKLMDIIASFPSADETGLQFFAMPLLVTIADDSVNPLNDSLRSVMAAIAYDNASATLRVITEEFEYFYLVDERYGYLIQVPNLSASATFGAGNPSLNAKPASGSVFPIPNAFTVARELDTLDAKVNATVGSGEFSNLVNRVSKTETSIAGNTKAISDNAAAIDEANNAIHENQTSIFDHALKILSANNAIRANAEAITVNTESIKANTEQIGFLSTWVNRAKADALRTLGYSDTEIAECIEDVPDLTPDDVAYARSVAEAWDPDKATYTSANLTDSRLRILPKLAFNEAATVQNLFQKCPELAYVPTLDFPKATSIPYIWFNLTKLKRLPTINAPVATSISALYSTANDTVKILPTVISLPEATSLMNLFFSQSAEAMSCVQELNLDKTKIKTTEQAFTLSGVDSFMLTDLPNVTNPSAMYRRCHNIKGDQSEVKWNMPAVTTIHGMFADMEALTALDVSGIKTENCTDMGECFGWTPALESLDLTGWNAEKVTSAEGMFFGCGARSIKWPDMKFAEGCSIGTMFYEASRLVTLDIAGADFTGAVQNGSNNPIFGLNNALENIIGPVSGIRFNINLSSASKLTPESAMVVINGLAQTDTTLKLWLHRNVYDKLTPEQIAIATAKGWTVARV